MARAARRILVEPDAACEMRRLVAECVAASLDTFRPTPSSSVLS